MEMAKEDTINELKILEEQRNRLQEEIWKVKGKPEGGIAYILLTAGFIFLSLAIVHTHAISAFIGIALTLWGALLLYTKPTKYIKKEILETSIEGLINDTYKIIDELDYHGTPKYFSPGTLERIQDVKLIIPKSDSIKLEYNDMMFTDKMLYDDPQIMVITPLGFHIAKLIEKELHINLSSTNIEYITNNIEKVLVEGLEIIRSLKINNYDNLIEFNIKGAIFDYVISKIQDQKKFKQMGDPLLSAIACVLALVTRKIIVIKEIGVDQATKDIKIIYELM